MGGMPFDERAFAASRRLWGGSEDGWLRSVDGRAAVRFRSANNTNIYCWISRGPAIANKDERTQLRYHHDIAWKARLTIKVAVFEKGIDPSIYPCGWQAMRHRPRSCGTKGKKKVVKMQEKQTHRFRSPPAIFPLPERRRNNSGAPAEKINTTRRVEQATITIQRTKKKLQSQSRVQVTAKLNVSRLVSVPWLTWPNVTKRRRGVTKMIYIRGESVSGSITFGCSRWKITRSSQWFIGCRN